MMIIIIIIIGDITADNVPHIVCLSESDNLVFHDSVVNVIDWKRFGWRTALSWRRSSCSAYEGIGASDISLPSTVLDRTRQHRPKPFCQSRSFWRLWMDVVTKLYDLGIVALEGALWHSQHNYILYEFLRSGTDRFWWSVFSNSVFYITCNIDQPKMIIYECSIYSFTVTIGGIISKVALSKWSK